MVRTLLHLVGKFSFAILKGHCYDRSMKGCCRSLDIIMNLPQLLDWPNPEKYVTNYITNFLIFLKFSTHLLDL
jgi:hypothetical protein